MASSSSYDAERQRKIVEFMQELRKLFALMVSTQRKYVDPSRAVDILRGSIGTSNGTAANAGTNVATTGDVANVTANNINILDNNQQDVSEFTHIVLEWVEEAFKLSPSKEAMTAPTADEKETNDEKAAPVVAAAVATDAAEDEDEDISERSEEVPAQLKGNPMSKLFYGQVKIEGFVHGAPFERAEAFGQWPLQVNSHSDIHESIEGSTAHEFFDGNSVSGASAACTTPSNSQQLPAAGQERWFTLLPPVLFLELSRFQYNTERKVAEKIHNRLDFPELIYMDRYMETNKQITKHKREEVRSLKERRANLKSRLNQFSSYVGKTGLEKGALSLPEVLQLTMDFSGATEGSQEMGAIPAHLKDVSMSSPSESAQQQPMVVDSPCHSPKVTTPTASLANLATDDGGVPMDVEMSETKDEGLKSHPGTSSTGCDNNVLLSADAIVSQKHPCPRHISEAEFKVLQTCLNRWKQEVSNDMAALESAITTVDAKIDNMYSDSNLRQLEYRLHAVMVHEGGVDSGHYWAYVRDHKRKVWLKFNDNTVNEASWEELIKESIGGHSNTSAYSLVYIDTSKPELLLLDTKGATAIGETQEDRMEEGEIEALVLSLPQDLAEHVYKDNVAFRDEISRWDKEQEERKRREVLMAKQQEAEMALSSSDPNNDIQVVQAKLTHVHTHAKLSIDQTFNIIKAVDIQLKSGHVENAINMAISKAYKLYNSQCQSQKEEPQLLKPHQLRQTQDLRLESFIIYLIKNGVKDLPIFGLALLEQFSLPGLETNENCAEEFRKISEKMLMKRREMHVKEVEVLRRWHQAYHWFRRSVHFFVSGIDSFLQHKFEESLDLFTEAHKFTTKLTDNLLPEAPCLGIQANMISHFLCEALREVNICLIKQFQLGENLADVTRSIKQLVVPVLCILTVRISQISNLNNSKEAHVLEEVRNNWCAILGEPDIPFESSAAITDVLRVILEPPQELGSNQSQDKRRELVDQNADMKLAERYVEIVKKYNDSLDAQTVTADSETTGPMNEMIVFSSK